MVQVADVKLPARTRKRFEDENNQQRTAKPHDIRSSIPLIDATNPAKFPPYIFREYPKMPLLDGNRPIVIDESGGVLVFYEAADEVEFKDLNPEVAEEIERNAPVKQMHERYAMLEDEVEKLKRKLREAGIEQDDERSGLAGVVQDRDDELAGGLKEQVRQAADRAAGQSDEKSKVGMSGNPLKK